MNQPHDTEALLATCAEDVRGFLAGMGVALDAVDDIAQETFVDYLRRPAARPDGVEPIRWLKGIARHKAYAWFRSRPALANRVRLAELLAEPPAPVSAGAGAHRERLDALRTCLERVTPDDRALLDAVYRDDARSEDIAGRLGATASGVRMQLLRLRERLRTCVERRLSAWGQA